MVYSETWSSYTVLLISTRPYDGAWRRSCAAASMIAAPCVATGIVEHVSKNPVCRARSCARRSDKPARSTQCAVVLEKPHINIASRPGPGLHLLRHLAIVPASTNLHVPTEPYGDVVSLLWQDGAQRLRHTDTHRYTDAQTHRRTW